MLGTVFNIQRFSLFDGPGVRTVVFLKGCPLRCIWCHNPEGIRKAHQIMYNPKLCIGCGECISACPNQLHFSENGVHLYSREKCIGCGKCASACVSGALSEAGREMSAEDVLTEVMKDIPIYRESGGGMTLSGGEPFFQPDFALSLLRGAKENAISTCVETCGFVPQDVMRKAAECVDTFLYDYKATGEENHKRLCGVSQGLILDNLSLLSELSANVVLRCPIVPEQNENSDHIAGIGRTARDMSCIKSIQLEPYHRLGVSKSEKLGVKSVYDSAPPQRAMLEEYCKQISSVSGKECTIS